MAIHCETCLLLGILFKIIYSENLLIDLIFIECCIIHTSLPWHITQGKTFFLLFRNLFRHYYFEESAKRGLKMMCVCVCVHTWFHWVDLLDLQRALDAYEILGATRLKNSEVSWKRSLAMWWNLVYYYWEISNKTEGISYFLNCTFIRKKHMVNRIWFFKMQLTTLSHPTPTTLILSVPIPGYSPNVSSFICHLSRFLFHRNI